MPIYMRRDGGSAPFTPGPNTIFYFPFDGDSDDYGGNGFILSDSGTVETLGVTFDTAVTLNQTTQGGIFASTWMKLNSQGSGYSSSYDGANLTLGYIPGYICYRVISYWNNLDNDSITYTYSSGPRTSRYSVGATSGDWKHLVWYWSDTDGGICFVNGVKYILNPSLNPYSGYGDTYYDFFQNKSPTDKASLTLSDTISESVIWSDQQVTDYFNATKSKYGVS